MQKKRHPTKNQKNTKIEI